jgi:hypothetical protein
MGVVEALGGGIEYGAGPGSVMLRRGRFGSGDCLIKMSAIKHRGWGIRVVSGGGAKRRLSKRRLRRHQPRPTSAPLR